MGEEEEEGRVGREVRAKITEKEKIVTAGKYQNDSRFFFFFWSRFLNVQESPKT